MHPAWSIIFFTSISGLGLGLASFIVLGLVDLSSFLNLFLASSTVFGLVGAGLLSSGQQRQQQHITKIQQEPLKAERRQREIYLPIARKFIPRVKARPPLDQTGKIRDATERSQHGNTLFTYLLQRTQPFVLLPAPAGPSIVSATASIGDSILSKPAAFCSPLVLIMPRMGRRSLFPSR